jgi:hypothetical protein
MNDKGILGRYDPSRELFHPRSLAVINMELYQQRQNLVASWLTARHLQTSTRTHGGNQMAHTESHDDTTAEIILTRIMFAGICRSVEIAGGATGLTSTGTMNAAFDGGRGLSLRCDVNGHCPMKDIFMNSPHTALFDGVKLFLVLVRRDRILNSPNRAAPGNSSRHKTQIATTIDKGSAEWQSRMMSNNQGAQIKQLHDSMGSSYEPDNYWRFEPFATTQVCYTDANHTKPTVPRHVIEGFNWSGACVYIGSIKQSPTGSVQQCNRLRSALTTMLYADVDQSNEVGDVITTHHKLRDMVINLRNNMRGTY